jgi:biopolymer transport protein ExbB
MNEATGLMHFVAQSDFVGKGLFMALLLMSVVSWYYIILKSISQYLTKKRSQAFMEFFWSATSLDMVKNEIAAKGVTDPFSHLASQALSAREHHERVGVAKLAEAGSLPDFLTRTLRKAIDEETTQLESGLTVLASVGSTAPFVGLFGTVWGVYHALIAIGASGTASLDKIAGPVGEALIMTGLGLAVAIPAVLGYNALVRSNRVLLGRLDAFAYDLFAFLTTGQQVNPGSLVVRETPVASGNESAGR